MCYVYINIIGVLFLFIKIKFYCDVYIQQFNQEKWCIVTPNDDFSSPFYVIE